MNLEPGFRCPHCKSDTTFERWQEHGVGRCVPGVVCEHCNGTGQLSWEDPATPAVYNMFCPHCSFGFDPVA